MIRKLLAFLILVSVVRAENIPETVGQSPIRYRQATRDSALVALDRARQLLADGAISEADARKAGQDDHMVDVKSSPENGVQTPVAVPSIYRRPETSISIQITGARSEAEQSEVTAQLDRQGAPFLTSIRRIEFKAPPAPVGDEANLGTEAADDSKGVVTLYTHESLADTLAMGIGAHMFDYGLAPIDKSYWRENGGRADYIFAYAERLAASDNPLIPTVATAR